MGYIYLLTNKINQKQYVGQTNNIDNRWNQYKRLKQNNIGRCLYNAFIKYGINNFKFQIICICFDDDCNKYEIDYIKKLNTIVPNGYNLESGGNTHKCHPDTARLISNTLKGNILSQETKNKISKSTKGHIVRIETRMKISKKLKEQTDENVKKRRIDLSEESKLKINYGLLIGVEINKKKVGQYDRNNNLLKEFNSISEAGIINNICIRSISKVCNNKKYSKTAGGFVWKFIK